MVYEYDEIYEAYLCIDENGLALPGLETELPPGAVVLPDNTGEVITNAEG